MNVVHVFPYPASLSGGHSNAIRSFIWCQRQEGIHAVGIAPKGAAESAEVEFGFPLAEVDSLWALRWKSLVERFEVSSGDSLVHFHSVDRRMGPFQIDLRAKRVPYVLTSHGQLGFQNLWRWFEKFSYLHLVDRGPLRAAGLHVLTALAVRRAKLLLPGFGGTVLVQGNLADPPPTALRSAGGRSDYGIPDDAFVMAFLGRLDVHVKGLDLLVEAFARMPERGWLVLAGPDWQGGQAQLERLAGELGCRNRICFPGAVYGDKKWALLGRSDVFVSPSRWEAFGIAQVEAMLLGVPVITSTQGSLAPELREADAAVLVRPSAAPIAQALAVLEADAELRQAVGKRGKLWAEKSCSPRSAGARFRDFYRSILDKPVKAQA